MSSLTSSRSSTPSKKALGIILGTEDYRYHVLEPHSILLEDGTMAQDRWTTLAFALGVPAREGQRHTSDTYRLVQKMKRRRILSESQTADLMMPFIESLVAQHPKLSRKIKSQYWSDPVPEREDLKNTIHRLATPTPTISVGYVKNSFSLAHNELQTGLIAGPNGEPCDLQRISQPLHDHFWPFFVVEVSDVSIEAASQASAVSAATCNNALKLLSTAAADEEKAWSSKSFVFDNKFARSFSLSVYGRTARLGTVGPDGPAPHVSSTIATFQLDNELEVASLADRIHSIMVWAQYNRLGEITATLDQLDRKVNGRLSGFTFAEDSYDFDPATLKSMKLRSPRRPDRLKVAIRASMPSWLRSRSPGLRTC